MGITLLKSEIEFIRLKNLEKSQKGNQDEEINAEYNDRQSKINAEYDELEEEYVKPIAPPLDEADLDEAKALYRTCLQLVHP